LTKQLIVVKKNVIYTINRNRLIVVVDRTVGVHGVRKVKNINDVLVNTQPLKLLRNTKMSLVEKLMSYGMVDITTNVVDNTKNIAYYLTLKKRSFRLMFNLDNTATCFLIEEEDQK
jgi:hypothetical protein